MGSEDRVSRNRPSGEDVGATIFFKGSVPSDMGKEMRRQDREGQRGKQKWDSRGPRAQQSSGAQVIPKSSPTLKQGS